MKLRALIVAIVLVVAAVAVYVGKHYFPATESTVADHSAAINEGVAEPGGSTFVKLPTEKLKAACLRVSKLWRAADSI